MKKEINLEAQLTMAIGEITQDVISATEVIKNSGIGTTSPMAEYLIQIVFDEIRRVRQNLKYPMPTLDDMDKFFGGPNGDNEPTVRR